MLCNGLIFPRILKKQKKQKPGSFSNNCLQFAMKPEGFSTGKVACLFFPLFLLSPSYSCQRGKIIDRKPSQQKFCYSGRISISISVLPKWLLHGFWGWKFHAKAKLDRLWYSLPSFSQRKSVQQDQKRKSWWETSEFWIDSRWGEGQYNIFLSFIFIKSEASTWKLRKPLEPSFCFKLKLNKNALDPGSSPTTINGDSVVTRSNSVGDPLLDTFSQLNLSLKIVVMGKNERRECFICNL